MAAVTTVSVGRTRTGYCVRIEGRGTLRESPAVHAFADLALADPENDLVLDLSACDFVDSTFMGCMAWLQRRYGASGAKPARVAFVTPPPSCRRVIETMHLEGILNLIPRAPALVGDRTVIPAPQLTPEDLGRHILECHRRLVELDSSNEAIFGPIVARLARDFEQPKG